MPKDPLNFTRNQAKGVSETPYVLYSPFFILVSIFTLFQACQRKEDRIRPATMSLYHLIDKYSFVDLKILGCHGSETQEQRKTLEIWSHQGDSGLITKFRLGGVFGLIRKALPSSVSGRPLVSTGPVRSLHWRGWTRL